MTAIKILAYLAAGIFILTGGFFVIGAFGEEGQTGWILIGVINFVIGFGLIWPANRQAKTSLSVERIMISLAASILIIIGDFLVIYALGDQIHVGAMITGLVSIIAGFGIIWFSQMRAGAAKEEIIPITQVLVEPAVEAKPEEGRKKQRVRTLIISLVIIALGILSIGVFAAVYFLRTMIPLEVGGIALEFPVSWRQFDPQEIDVEDQEMIIALAPPKGNGFFKVSRWQVDEQSMDSFAKGMYEGFENNPDAKLLSKEIIIVGGEEAISWLYTGTCPGYPDRTCKYLSVITQKGPSCYLISYVDDLAAFDRYQPNLDKILASIHLLPADSRNMLCSSHNTLARYKYEQAQSLEDQEEFAEAEKLYRQAIQLDANFCDAMDNLGVLLRKQGKIDEAIGWYQKSLEIKPENQLALLDMGIAYTYQGKMEQAIQTFEKLIKIAPDSPEGYYNLGVAYFCLKQYEKAIANLQTSEEIYGQTGSPAVVDAQLLLGQSYFALEDCAKTKGYLQPIYDQCSDDGQVNFALGVCYLDTEPKDLELAKKYLIKAEQLGFKLPDELVTRLVQEFGEWPLR